MSRLLAGFALAAVVVGCSKPPASTPNAEAPKANAEPVKPDPKVLAAQEEEAVKLVEKLGGKVKRDDTLPDKPVVGIEMRNASLTDADLKKFGVLPHLTSLTLRNTKITDEGWRELATFKKLTTLTMENADFQKFGELRKALPDCKCTMSVS